MTEQLLVQKLSPSATVPSRGSALAAGYDLSSAHDCVVPARGKALVKTDLAIALPALAALISLAWRRYGDTIYAQQTGAAERKKER